MNVKLNDVRRSTEITRLYLRFLDQHIQEVLNDSEKEFYEIHKIAEHLCLSPSHLSDTIQKETGHHPCYFYDKKIIEVAKNMILQSDESIASIAKKLTYDPSNFSKFFKKHTGITPGVFKKKYLKNLEINYLNNMS